jgi:hypothetical protein
MCPLNKERSRCPHLIMPLSLPNEWILRDEQNPAAFLKASTLLASQHLLRYYYRDPWFRYDDCAAVQWIFESVGGVIVNLSIRKDSSYENPKPIIAKEKSKPPYTSKHQTTSRPTHQRLWMSWTVVRTLAQELRSVKTNVRDTILI